MRNAFVTILFFCCILFPFLFGLGMFAIGMPWWSAVLAVLTLAWFVGMGLVGNDFE